MVDGIDLEEELRFIDKSYFSKFKPNSNSDVNADVPTSINKATKYDCEGMARYIRIVKSKKKTLIMQKL